MFCSRLFSGIPATFGDANIGRLAVNVAANTLLAAGADPRYMCATITVDSDTPVDLVNTIAQAMNRAAIDATPRLHAIALPYSGMRRAIGDMAGNLRPDIDRNRIPVSESVKAIAEISETSPLDMPTADALVIAVHPCDAATTLAAIRRNPHGSDASVIGTVS